MPRNRKRHQVFEKPISDNAVIYLRTSTHKQQKEGFGIESQEIICREKVKCGNLKLQRIFKDVGISGAKSYRSGAEELIAYLEAQSTRTYVVTYEVARVARDIEIFIDLKKRIKKAGGIIQYVTQQVDDTPRGRHGEAQSAINAQLFREEASESTTLRMLERLRLGYWPFNNPPYGFKHVALSENGKVLVHDELANVMKGVLEEFASGRIPSQVAVAAFLESVPGFPKNKQGEVNVQRIANMLSNPLYAGIIEYQKWGVEARIGNHQPIISVETHEKILVRLGIKHFVERKDANENYPLRGVILCSCCKKPMTASAPRGRKASYPAYHCKTKGCIKKGRTKGLSASVVHGNFMKVLDDYQFPDGMTSMFREMTKDIYAEEEIIREESLNHKKGLLKQISNEIQGCLDKLIKLSSDVVIKQLESKIDQLTVKKSELESEIYDEENNTPDFENIVGTVLEFFKKPQETWLAGSFIEKRTVSQLVFNGQTAYDPETGFGTAAIASPLRVLKEISESNCGVVPEPQPYQSYNILI